VFLAAIKLFLGTWIKSVSGRVIVKVLGGLAVVATLWGVKYLVWDKPRDEFNTQLEAQKTTCRQAVVAAAFKHDVESDQMISSINLVGKANNILRKKIAEMNSTKRANKVMCQIKVDGLETTLIHCQSDLNASRNNKEITYVKDKSCTNIDFHSLSS